MKMTPGRRVLFPANETIDHRRQTMVFGLRSKPKSNVLVSCYQIHSASTVLSFSTFPVLEVVFGSSIMIQTSSSATGMCSTPLWDDDKFAFTDGQVALAEFDGQCAFDDKEQFIFVLVMMPDKFALHFGEFDIGVVQFTGDFGTPLFSEQVEFFVQVDYLLSYLSSLSLPVKVGRGCTGACR